MASQKTLFFLGASGGCGLSALRRSLAAGHTCIALCRNPSKLTAIFPEGTHPNLHIKQGNAHDSASMSDGLISPLDSSKFVDVVISSIGGAFDWKTLGNDDPHVCEKGMSTLLNTIKSLRVEKQIKGHPRIISVSTTGISAFGRDLPFAMIPIYRILAHAAHVDKRAMEELLYSNKEEWTVVRASLLTQAQEALDKEIRVGVEDPVKGVEESAIGYTISREDVGRWIFENILQKNGDDRYVDKVASITN